jgi:hypothetical protein
VSGTRVRDARLRQYRERYMGKGCTPPAVP